LKSRRFLTSNLPENFWYNKNSIDDDLSVHFYHDIAIQPTADCLSRQIQNHKALYSFSTRV